MDPISYSRTFWAGLLTGEGRGHVSFNGSRWLFRSRARTEFVESTGVHEVRVILGFFWSSLEVITLDGRVTFRGLAHRGAEHLRGAWALASVPDAVAKALTEWTALRDSRRYVNHRAWAGWKERHTPTRTALESASVLWLGAQDRRQAETFRELIDNVEDVARQLNVVHQDRELRECEALFDDVESAPLTLAQRRAVVTDEDHTLVVAGAGTGKTSVVVAKVAYLTSHLGVRPDDILVLAFNRAAVDEVRKRIQDRAAVNPVVSTFHALGLRIVAEAAGRKPSLSRLEEQGAVSAFIDDELRGMLASDGGRLLVDHLISYLHPYERMDECADKHAYIRALKGRDIQSMRGEQVRSYEECVIADWLFLNGIDYEYERDYEHDLATVDHPQYRPDFYLVESGVYVEHFGVGRDGTTAPWIDAEKYRAGMEWKRSMHQKYGTSLVETFTYDRVEGELASRLSERLAAVGVQPKPLSPSELEQRAGARGAITALAGLLATFLKHFKETGRTIEQLFEQAQGRPDRNRALSFVRLFDHVLPLYRARLVEEKAIDFADMIGLAAFHVESGTFLPRFRYVIVDEFQDISRGRARLLRGLVDHGPDVRLMCVGDDWQSIYRFGGSDVSLMTRFGDHFGYSATVTLDSTFRFGTPLLEVTSQFVQRNPVQLRKDLTSDRDGMAPAVVIVAETKIGAAEDEWVPGANLEDLRGVLRRITALRPGGASVYLLGRYHFNLLPAGVQRLAREFPQLELEFLTVHGAKGLQADFVVVLQANSGRFGFPCEIEDDPMLSMVLADSDAMLHAEERRLFYVALTRARERVYVLSRETQRSAFVEEFLADEYAGLVELPQEWAERVACPDCGGSLTRRRNAKSGAPFWGCVDYPYCEGSARVCAVCQEGALVLAGLFYRCSRTGCAGRVDVCPRCGEGMLVRRLNGRSGKPFLGCSRWKPNGGGCDYTRKVDEET